MWKEGDAAASGFPVHQLNAPNTVKPFQGWVSPKRRGYKEWM